MRRFARPTIGLLGQAFVIILLTVAIEFGASTLLYERTSRLSAQEDEAARVAEHLVVARRLVGASPPAERAAAARQVSTDRYAVAWRPTRPERAALAPELDALRQQIVAWEPSLASSGLQLRLRSPGRRNVVEGSLRLPDGSWLDFATGGLVAESKLALNRILLALFPAVALIAIGGLMVRVLLRPVRRLAVAADGIGRGATVLVSESGPDEVRHVIRAFNEMQARIDRLIADRTQALAAVGHDLRTPIARLRLRADAIADAETRTAQVRDLAEMEAMIESLMAFFGGEQDPEPAARIDLAVMLATIVDDAEDQGRDARYVGPEHLDATARPIELKRAVANLVGNALQYGERVTVALDDAGDRLVIAVEDDGPGIPETALATVIRPFERLDAARSRNTEGLGLGLAIVARAVDREGGTLRLSNRPEGGLRVEIMLPR